MSYTLSQIRIACHAGEDFIGDDDLYGVIGGMRWSLGRYRAGDVKDRPDIAFNSNEIEWKIYEKDEADPDDFLAVISLDVPDNTTRIAAFESGTAKYTIQFKVLKG